MRKKQAITNNDDVVAALMKKAQELNDPELLAMATAMSEQKVKPKAKPKKKAVKSVKKVKVKPEPVVEKDEDDDGPKKLVKFSRWKPPSGPNKFVDDGKSCRDKEDEKIKKLKVITESKRPKFRLVRATCSVCERKVEVHPMYNTEFFRCEKCTIRN
jgi:hypothetical protein